MEQPRKVSFKQPPVSANARMTYSQSSALSDSQKLVQRSRSFDTGSSKMSGNLQVPLLNEDHSPSDEAKETSPFMPKMPKMHNLNEIERMDNGEIQLDEDDDLTSEDDEDLQTVVVAEDLELDDVYDEGFMLVEASFGRMLTSQVTGM
jgi:hypothetical protein